MTSNESPPKPLHHSDEEKSGGNTRIVATSGYRPITVRKEQTKVLPNDSQTARTHRELPPIPQNIRLHAGSQALPALPPKTQTSEITQRRKTIGHQYSPVEDIKEKMTKLLHKPKKKAKGTDNFVIERTNSKPTQTKGNGESAISDSKPQSNQDKKVITFEIATEKALRILQELIETEESYLNDLKRLYSVYSVGLSSILSKSDHNTVFLNLRELISLTELLFVLLKTVPISNPFQIGSVFIDVQDDFSREYGTFCKGYERANETIRSLKRKDSKVKDFLNHAKQSDEKQMSIADYLIKPVQRICRYPLLLQEMQRNELLLSTDLKNAIEYTRIILNTINKKVADQEKISHLLKICGKTSFYNFVGKDFDGTVLDDRTLFCFKQWPSNKTKLRALYGIITPTHFLFSYPSKGKVALEVHPLEFILANEQSDNYVVEVSFIKAQKKLFFEFDIYFNQVDWCHTISTACDKARAKKDPLTQQIIEQEQKKLDELLDRTILNPHPVSNESPNNPSSNSFDILSLFEQTSKV